MHDEWSEEAISNADENFWAFLYIVWVCIGLPQPTRCQLDIANYLQHNGERRFIIQAFRGIGKSFITCAYVVWRLWRERDLRIMIVSAGGDRADANARFIKKIIASVPFLADEMKATKDQLDTQNIFEVGGAIADASPSVKSVGIYGQITGSRADIIVADDCEIPRNSATQEQRVKLSEAVKEFDAILKPNGVVLYLGTPQCEASLYNELLSRGYVTRIWTALVPTQKERENYGTRLAPYIDKMFNEGRYGVSTDPERFTDEDLAERLRSYGKAGFQLQFMLNTALSDFDKYPLKCADLIVAPLDMSETSLKWSWSNGKDYELQDVPCVGLKGDMFYSEFTRSADVMPYGGSVMTIDPSGRGADETTYCITKFLAGYIFVMEVGGMKEGYSDLTMTRLAQRAKLWGVNHVLIESNFGDGMFEKLISPVFRKVHPVSIEGVRHTQQKEVRIIDTLEPIMMAHKLIFNRSVIEQDFGVYESKMEYSLIYQLTRICKDKGALGHDDRLDVLAMACAYWSNVMDVTSEDVQDTVTEDFLFDAIFGDGLIGMITGQTTQKGKAVDSINRLREGR